MADLCVNKERLRNLKEADRQQRKMEAPEQHDGHLKGHRERCATVDRQKAYREKQKTSETEDQKVERYKMGLVKRYLCTVCPRGTCILLMLTRKGSPLQCLHLSS